MEQNLLNQNNPNQVGKKQPILKITKGKLGTRTKKRDNDDEEAAAAERNRLQQREIRGMEEMYWKVVFQLRKLEEIQKLGNTVNIFDLLYEPYELYPDVRKRNQIELLKAVVFELKKDFN